MSAGRGLAERLLRHAAQSLSARRQPWAAAALSEMQTIEGKREAILWALGAAGMIARDLAEQAFFPWRRDPRQRPPSGFIATLGLLLLAGPAWMAAEGGSWPLVLRALAGIAVMLALWINAAAVLRSQHLGRLHYAVGIRALPLNIAVTALAVAIGGALL